MTARILTGFLLVFSCSTLTFAEQYEQESSQRHIRSHSGGSGMVHELQTAKKEHISENSVNTAKVDMDQTARGRLSDQILEEKQESISRRIPRSRTGGSGMTQFHKLLKGN